MVVSGGNAGDTICSILDDDRMPLSLFLYGGGQKKTTGCWHTHAVHGNGNENVNTIDVTADRNDAYCGPYSNTPQQFNFFSLYDL
jgi:hypothetical protein